MSPPVNTGHENLSRPLAWALLLLLVTTFGLRAWYAFDDPRPDRFWDERYSLMNVQALLGEGGEWPAKAFYPTLSYLPQMALLGPLHWACDERQLCDAHVVEAVTDRRGRERVAFTPLAYRLCRLLPALFGTLCVLWVFRIGRRLVGPETALLAAAFLAAVPAHLRMSGIFKPDILMSWLMLVAVEAALLVALRPSLRRYLWAGAAVGLAASAKYNGVAAALPLAVGTLFGILPGPRRRPARAGWLVWAGVASMLVFLALNPHVFTATEIFVQDNWNTVREYEWRGEQAGTTRADLVPRFAASLLTGFFHGPLVGVLALVGLPLLVAAVFLPRLAAVEAHRPGGGDGVAGREAVEARRRESWAVVAAAPLGYLALYVYSTTNPGTHNWLPLVPFTSLAAAFVAGRAWALLAPRLSRRAAVGLAAAALVAALVAVPVRAGGWVYHLVVPSTAKQAEDVLLRELPRHLRHRLVIYDGDERMRVKRSGGNKAILVHREELHQEDLRRDDRAEDAVAELAAGADAVVALAPRGTAPPPCAAPPGRLRRAPFTAWGPALTVAVHPWRPAGEMAVLERAPDPGPRGAGAGRATLFTVPAPDLPAGGRLSFEILPPAGTAPADLAPVLLEGHEIRTFWGETGHRRFRLLSERVAPPAGPGPWRLAVGSGGDPGVVRMLPWRPPPPCG